MSRSFARRADRPGPDAAAPGRCVPGTAAPDGYVLINTQATASSSSAWASIAQRSARRDRLVTVPATEISLKHVGRAVPNARLLGGFAALSGLISLDAVVRTRSARNSAARSPRPMSPRRPRPTTSSKPDGRRLDHAQAD